MYIIYFQDGGSGVCYDNSVLLLLVVNFQWEAGELRENL